MESYSGCLGIVLELDNATKQTAKQIAKQLEDSVGCEYMVSRPHITLYHGNFRNIPGGLIGRLIYEICLDLGKAVHLSGFSPYGGKFIFWAVSDVGSVAIHNAHLVVLHELSPYLEPREQAPAEKEELQMSEEEKENIKRFGHPLVRNLYRPHITLIYNSNGVNANGLYNWTAQIINVALVEIGDFGSIKSVLFSIS